MQFLLIIANAFSGIDFVEELVTVLGSIIAFSVLISFHKRKRKDKGKKMFKHIDINADDDRATECGAGAHDDKHYVQIDKALRTAFEQEEYWKVLKCWRELGDLHQSSIHLSMFIKAMQFCNKGAYFITTELRHFFKAHPKECSIGLINDLLEPLARRPDDAQLADLLARMILSLNLVKDSRTYEIVLTMYAANSNLDKAEELMAEMKSKAIEFTPRAMVAIMAMALQVGNCDAVLKAFIKLKPAWDERCTWPVSMFAMERHKTNVLMQIVTLACQEQKVSELCAALDGIAVPEEALDAAQSKFSLLADADLATIVATLGKSGINLKTDPIYNILIGCLNSRSIKSLSPWRAKDSMREDSNSLASDSDDVVDCSSSLKTPLTPWKATKSASMKQSLPPWRVKNSDGDNNSSSASTSEGSRSDSEEESYLESYTRVNFGPCFTKRTLAPPPGL